ncbi:MAG: transposase [Planctomycetes bacterium]|nr:transposase [Planctomycetota bacterium]
MGAPAVGGTHFFDGWLCAHLSPRRSALACLVGLCPARRGWAAGHLAHGYKLFLYSDSDGRIIAYQVHAMNRAEQAVALELIPHATRPGYTLGDSVYDTQACHDAAAACGQQLIAPRKDPAGSISTRANSPQRMHAIAMLETPTASRFGVEMYKKRTLIERVFSVMTSATVGMDSLPPWVRTLRRVRQWVDAMVVFYLVFAK